MNWVVVSDWKDIPEGMWLVKLNKPKNQYHVAYVHPNVTVVGGMFHFDAGKPLAYAEFKEFSC